MLLRYFVGAALAFLTATQAFAFETVWSRADLSYSSQDFAEHPQFNYRKAITESFLQIRNGDLFLGFGGQTVSNLRNETLNRAFGLEIGYAVSEQWYLSAAGRGFADSDVKRFDLLAEYSPSSDTTLGVHFRKFNETDWTQTDLILGHDFERGFIGAELRRWGLPGEKSGFFEAFGVYDFGTTEVAGFAGIGALETSYYRYGVTVDYGVTGQIGLVAGLGAEGDDRFRSVHTALGANFAVSSRVRIEGLVGQELFKRNGQARADSTTFGLQVVIENGAPRSMEKRLNAVSQQIWRRVRVFDY